MRGRRPEFVLVKDNAVDDVMSNFYRPRVRVLNETPSHS